MSDPPRPEEPRSSESNMLNDPPAAEAGRFRHWITDVEVSPGNTDPSCKFSARIFVDDELVCNLSWIDHTRPLRWSGLLLCNVSLASKVSLRLCRSFKGKPRYFNFSPLTISEVDEETGESILELPEAAWVVTIKSLTSPMANERFMDERDKLNNTEGIYGRNDPGGVKYWFKAALQFASIVSEVIPECNAKVSFLVYLNAWEFLEKQTEFEETILELLRGFTRIREIVDTVAQASDSVLAIAMGQLEGPITGILALLEDVSVYIYNHYTTNDLVHTTHDEAGANGAYDVEAYLALFEALQREFYTSWSFTATSYEDPTNVVDNGPSEIPQQNIHALVDEPTKRIDPYEILNQLRPMDPSGYDPDQACLEGTREAVLSKIITWTQNRDSSERFMWISGQAGMGKTSIATSLCQRLDNIGALAGTLVMIIDGLDECGDRDSREKLLHKLYDMSRLVSWLKIIITARPLGDIQQYFLNHCPNSPIIQLRDYESSGDIRAYIQGQLGQIARKDHWADNSISQLCTMAQGVFLWAKLAIKYIKGSTLPTMPRLRVILNNQKSPVTDQFDALYTQALITALGDDGDELKNAYLRCIGAVLATSEREPLSIPDLQYFLLVAGQIDQPTLEQILNNLSPLLLVTREGHARFHHASFKDYVTSLSRSGEFFVCLDQYEANPAICCLKVMQQDLRFNICGLETSHLLNSEVPDLKLRIHSHIGSTLKYACIHWIDHFTASPNQVLIDAAKSFFEGPQLMYWIETLSLLGCLDVALTGLSTLTFLGLTQFADWNLIVSSAKDAHRFLLTFYSTIVASTPHLYISALAFAPSTSLTAQRMRPFFPNTISIPKGDNLAWHPCVKSILHPHPIQSLSISFDGLRVATGYPDGSVCIWDLRTGARIRKPLVGHSTSVTCVAFSPNSNFVASSSYDTAILAWDLSGAVGTRYTLTGHSGSVHAIAFSPNTTMVASGSSDKTIRLWDTKTMQPVGQPYTGHSNRISCLALSPDGARLVSGSWDQTIRVWSVDLGGMQLAINPLLITGHSDLVTCVAFSSDGLKIISGSADKAIRMWNTQTGRTIDNHISFARHSDSITSVAFSPGGEVIASSSSDGVIQLWDSTKLVAYSQRFGHSNSVNCVAFSHDGSYVVSGSTDSTTRIWEVSACSKIMTMARIPTAPMDPASIATSPFVGHSDAVYSIALSSDGTCMVSGSGDNTLRPWDTQTGTQIGDLYSGHSDCVNSVAFSPDGAYIVSGSDDETLKRWDTTTRAVINTHQHGDIVNCVAFAPNGEFIAFGSADQNVYLWDPVGWKMIGNAFKGHSSDVLSVAFSPDGVCLASASADRTIMLWDVEIGDLLGKPLSGHTDYVRSVAFSPCGAHIVSGSDDRTVRIWDRKTGSTLQILSGHFSWVQSVAFSPDGSYIASSSSDKTVRLWSSKTGQVEGEPLTGHTDSVFCIAFSSNGRYILSGSMDNTIRSWDLVTSHPTAVHPVGEPASDSATEPPVELPGTFCWPESPYELSAHSRQPGWVTHNQKSLVFWLPAHYQQPDQFLSAQTRVSYQKTLLDYSKFTHGIAWTRVACDSIRRGSE
ncbi:unnamed protein product [Rhizoctonia solani]|uniref:Vegetative incompatibility protein HET-E-1 n=1 Tax=Rhizoctonia solani TaxID=456999 RepID=A0A8H3CFE7_9AGAM|nr:unnamed protein product [Rhizoctonia solani]